MSIQVLCQCGQRFAAPEHLAGKTGKCPKCGQPLTIPSLAEGSAPAPSGGVGDLLEEVGLGGKPEGHACPMCNTLLPEDAVLCVQCGYHMGKGKALHTRHEGSGQREPDHTQQLMAQARRDLAAEENKRVSFAARRQAMGDEARRMISPGMKMVQNAVACELLFYLMFCVGACFATPHTVLAFFIALGLLLLARLVLAVIGRANCMLATPDRSGRGFIVLWFVAMPLAMVANVAMVFDPIPGLLLHLGLYYTGAVAWKLYLWKFSRFIGRTDIAAFALGLGIFEAASVVLIYGYALSAGKAAFVIGFENDVITPKFIMIFLAAVLSEVFVALAHWVLLTQLTD